ncbi:MAG: RNA polymerase sigma factor [Bryobacterales bacterium]|nr:RNA polymerase sigma factor [Acidobacteriota bacterium]MCB9385285.1 RNA polymerase sigma factor [Bryobacterales bacterium]
MRIEIEVIQRAQQGDETAFNQIVRTYSSRVLGAVYGQAGDAGEVEDIAQEVFVRVWKSISQLREVELFEPWLYRLASNTACDFLRRKRRRKDLRLGDMSDEQALAVEAKASTTSFEGDEERREAVRLTRQLLARLSDADRELLTLKEVQGLSLRELEQVYGVNTNAMKVRLFRARKRALQELETIQTPPTPSRPLIAIGDFADATA